MATTAPTSSNIPGKPTYSCLRCADRKVKCDRNTPCSACVRHSVECVYNPSPPPRNRHRRLNNQILTDRLRYYEALLQKKGVDLDKLQQVPNPETRPPIPRELQVHIPDPAESVNKTRVIQAQGCFKLIDNILWTRVVDELHDPQDAFVDSPDNTNDPEGSDYGFGFVLPGDHRKAHTKPRHPSPKHIHQLWQIYIENIDPLTKILHVPTLRPEIEKAASNTGAVSRSFDALMFAIYSAAVMSLTDDDCKQRLGEPRKVLLSQYISATQAALSRANFMGATSLVVLQALLIHLLAVRDIYEPRAIWSLTGVAVRIAQGMGLERDGIYLGLPPFETEMRRRIWWQLKMHDFRTAELCGIRKFQGLHIDAESTKWPTNVNDDQLYPGMTSLPTESKHLTDIIFVSLKCELLKYAVGRAADFRRQGKTCKPWDPLIPGSDTSAEVDRSVMQIEELLEDKYLRYCDPSQPLHLMAMLMARCSIDTIRFTSHHPRRWARREQAPGSERQRAWEICIKLLERNNMLQSSPQLKQFAWHAPYFQQWHAIIHMLDTLRSDPVNTDADKAWRLIGSTYDNNPEMACEMRKPIHVAVGNLCLKAYSNRETAMRNGNMHASKVPKFIVQLRQQREAVTARTRENHAKSGQPETEVTTGQLGAHIDTGPNNDTNTLLDSTTDLEQSTKSLPSALLSDSIHASSPLEREPFQFPSFGIIGGGQAGGIPAVDMDFDFMLDQDYYDWENGASHNTMINWDQWDSWLADSNVMHPLSSIEDRVT